MIPISLIQNFFKRGWEIIAVCTILSGLTAMIITSYQTPQFQAVASYIVSPNIEEENTDFRDSLYGIDSLSRMTTANTYSEIMSSDRIIVQAAYELDISSVERDAYTVDAVVLPETSIIQVSVSGPDPRLATKLADQIGKEAVGFIESIYEVYILTELDSANPLDAPVGFSSTTMGVLGSVVGLALGMLLALLRTPELIGITRTKENRSPARRPAAPVPQPAKRRSPSPAPVGNNAITQHSMPRVQLNPDKKHPKYR